MMFKIKLIFILILLAGVAYLVLANTNTIEETADRFNDPQSREQRIISELNKNLANIDKIFEVASSSTDLLELKGRVVLSKELLEESHMLVKELAETNKNNVSGIRSRMTELYRLFFPENK